MARSVTFNGMTQFRPGGLTRVNANALNQIGISTNGLIGLVGEADGGTPQEVVFVDDPALAKETYRSGPLADALRIAFDPSNDPRVPGGAFRCLCVKVNQGTQATLTLLSKSKADDTVAALSTATVINLTTAGLTVDALIGGSLRINGETREITDNDAGSVTVGTAFSSVPATGTTVEFLVPVITITSRDYGAHTNQVQFEYEPAVGDGQAWTTTFDGTSQVGEEVGGTAALIVEYVGERTQIVQAAGTTDGAGSATQLADSAGGFGTFTNFFVEADTAGALGETNLRKISVNAATTIDVTNDFRNGGSSTAPGTGTGYSVRTGMIRTGAASAGAAGTLTLESTLDVATNELQNMIVEMKTGDAAGQRRRITANTDGTSSVLSVSPNWESGSLPAATDTYEIQYNTEATASFAGSAGVASGFSTSIARNGGSAATDLSISFTGVSAVTTLNELIDTINANSNYVATLPGGVNGQTTLTTSFDFDLGHQSVEIGLDQNAVGTPPNPDADAVSTWANHFRRDLALVIDQINDTNEFVTADRATSGGLGAGGGRPEFTGGSIGTAGDTFQYLSGGTRGVSTNLNWQTALDLLLGERATAVVPLISEDLANLGQGSTALFASVAAQLQAHLGVANGIGKSERGGYLGMEGTLTQLIAQGNSLNDTDIAISGQQIQVLDVDGNLTLQPEWALAVAAAGMRAGMPEVGEPLTHKYLRTSQLTQDSSWDPADRTDANQLIAAGILFAESIRGKGTRFVRDLTSYVQDDNLAYAEGSVRDVVRYVSYGLRTLLEDRFTGVKATPTNAQGIKDTSSEFLELMRSNNIIVDSTDDDGNFVKAFHNLRVTISGDIATVRVGVFPVVGINFQLNDIYLQLPSQAA
jgi:hypothetical protein